MKKEYNNFSDFNLNKQLLNAISDLGFDNPTPIQKKVIPLAISGHDVLGIAPTGTGKSAAFLIPLILNLKYAKPLNFRGLILAPTRELCIQIQEMAMRLSKYTNLKILAIFGGVGKKVQLEKIEEGFDLLITTPGRFIEFYLQGMLITRDIKVMVLDEADRMMEMGFQPQLIRILEVIPNKRQNMLFSATMPEKVLKVSEEFLEFPEKVEISPPATVAKTIEQHLYHVPNFLTKIQLLEWIIKNEKGLNKSIIFARSKAHTNNIFKFIKRKITDSVRVIHGNKDQNARFNAINDFREGEIKFLVATDVVSRGIDISDVSHIINFDVPMQYQDYVHRVGRTGRVEKSGKAITFSNPGEDGHIKHIEKLIKASLNPCKLPPDVKILETEREEKIQINRQIDALKRREDPNYQGAFHTKKVKGTNKKKRK